MGQKVNPIGLRLGIIKTWESQWFGGKNYADYIFEDYKLRKFIKLLELVRLTSTFSLATHFLIQI